MKPRIDLIAANVLAALCLFATIAFAAEPPTEPPAPLLFGLPAQDWICQDGTCQLRPTRQVIRQKTTSRPVFGLPAVNRTRTVQRVTPAVVAQAPTITSVAPVKTTVQVPVTEWIDEEYQVPVTRMETRVRKKAGHALRNPRAMGLPAANKLRCARTNKCKQIMLCPYKRIFARHQRIPPRRYKSRSSKPKSSEAEGHCGEWGN
jgi:hypothetical protein